MFSLLILTPEEPIFEGDVQALVAPGVIGYLEILTDHAPIITLLKQGDVLVRDSGGKEHTYVISSGVLEVHKNQATLLSDTIESSTQAHIHLSGLT